MPEVIDPRADVQQAVDALCSWLDANTWVDLNDDEAHVVDAIMHGARLLKWLPEEQKLALVATWDFDLLNEVARLREQLAAAVTFTDELLQEFVAAEWCIFGEFGVGKDEHDELTREIAERRERWAALSDAHRAAERIDAILQQTGEE